MQVIPFLICFPLLVAVLMYCIRADKVRNVIAYAGAVIIIAATAVLVAQWMMGGCQPMELYVHTEMVNHLILAGDFLLMIVVT
ncbi:MAG: NADH-quinone oxidoreductase subunit L, partial [Eubacterium sp.]|nr:NADH-quinone oxidoreductase subunit L [Eubacterium sp.]